MAPCGQNLVWEILLTRQLDDQISVDIASNSKVSPQTGYFVVYGKHAPGQHSQDFNIWGNQILQANVTFTPTPTPTLTQTPTPTPTPTVTPTRLQIYLPDVSG